eukprot:756889-Hanusia_phi.AAC.4
MLRDVSVLLCFTPRCLCVVSRLLGDAGSIQSSLVRVHDIIVPVGGEEGREKRAEEGEESRGGRREQRRAE